MDNNSLRKKCAKAWCKTIIPLDAKFKACDTCRTRDQDAQKKKRSREKAAVTTRVDRLKAQPRGTAPFWRHKILKPLVEADAEMTGTVVEFVIEEQERDDEGEGEDDDEEEDEGCVETHQEDGRTFEEAMEGDIELVLDFAKGLRHQIQFRDQRMLNAFQREGASFLRLAKACIGKEKRVNSTRAATVSTWEKSTSSAMFYCTRPTLADEDT